MKGKYMAMNRSLPNGTHVMLHLQLDNEICWVKIN